jgi:hypothetical protein
MVNLPEKTSDVISGNSAWRFVIVFGLAAPAVLSLVLGVDFSGQFFRMMQDFRI